MTTEAVYLDYNASAPLRPEARTAMIAALEVDGNASSVHRCGRDARAVVEAAREEVAALVGAKPAEVIFTSGATESNNWFAAAGWDTVMLAPIEHDSLYAPVRNRAGKVIEFSVGKDGVADVSEVAGLTLLSNAELGCAAVSLQMANNETGACQPVAETAAFAREHGFFVHTDAVQAAGRLPINLAHLGVDALSLSAHKIGGPKGIGALVLRDGATLPSFVTGGGQERRRRAGTENVAAIAGFGAAARASTRDLATMSKIAALRDALEDGIKGVTPNTEIIAKDAPRLANTSCFVCAGKRAETLLIKLDLEGVAVSSGAACSSGKVGVSRALEAMALAPELAQSALRISIGHATTREDITLFLKAWKGIHRSDQIAA